MDTTSPKSRDRIRKAVIDEIRSSEASTLVLKSRLNELAPISRFPSEVLAGIFSLLSIRAWNEGEGISAWIHVTHVCRRWRETALNYPPLWTHINFTKLTSVGMAETLFRAKLGPLHLEAHLRKRSANRFEVIGRKLTDHISHTRHLRISGCDPSIVIKWLITPTPDLESLTLSYTGADHVTVPDNLFKCTAPSLTTLQLRDCNIDWKSPLLRGLRILKIHGMSAEAIPELNDWLDTLDEMTQLKELSVQLSTPRAPLADPLTSRTVTLPSLTHFKIFDFAKDCALALAHLVFPALTCLHVLVISHDQEGEDVRLVIPSIVQNACVVHDFEPIRSILIEDEKMYTDILTWTTPGADVQVHGSAISDNMSRSACFLFSARGDEWNSGVNSAIADAVLTLLPMNSVSTLSAQSKLDTSIGLNKGFWLKYASRLPLLEQARLDRTTAGGFWEMLAEDIPLDSDSPQLPMLTKLILCNVELSSKAIRQMRDTLIKRVEQGVPLENLDLSKSPAGKYAVKILSEIVVDVQKRGYEGKEYGRVLQNRDEFDDGRGIRYSDTDEDDSDTDEDEYEDEDDIYRARTMGLIVRIR